MAGSKGGEVGGELLVAGGDLGAQGLQRGRERGLQRLLAEASRRGQATDGGGVKRLDADGAGEELLAVEARAVSATRGGVGDGEDRILDAVAVQPAVGVAQRPERLDATCDAGPPRGLLSRATRLTSR